MATPSQASLNCFQCAVTRDFTSRLLEVTIEWDNIQIACRYCWPLKAEKRRWKIHRLGWFAHSTQEVWSELHQSEPILDRIHEGRQSTHRRSCHRHEGLRAAVLRLVSHRSQLGECRRKRSTHFYGRHLRSWVSSERWLFHTSQQEA